jgi:hypothetical protein
MRTTHHFVVRYTDDAGHRQVFKTVSRAAADRRARALAVGLGRPVNVLAIPVVR